MFSYDGAVERVFIVHDKNDKQTYQCLLTTIAVLHKFCTNAFVYSRDASLPCLLEQYIHPNALSERSYFQKQPNATAKTLVVFDMRICLKHDEVDANLLVKRENCICVFIGDQTKKNVFLQCHVVISPHARFDKLCLGKRPNNNQQRQWVHCSQKNKHWTSQEFFCEREERWREKKEKQALDFVLAFIPIQDVVHNLNHVELKSSCKFC